MSEPRSSFHLYQFYELPIGVRKVLIGLQCSHDIWSSNGNNASAFFWVIDVWKFSHDRAFFERVLGWPQRCTHILQWHTFMVPQTVRSNMLRPLSNLSWYRVDRSCKRPAKFVELCTIVQIWYWGHWWTNCHSHKFGRNFWYSARECRRDRERPRFGILSRCIYRCCSSHCTSIF